MNAEFVVARLVGLASLAYQKRYILEATKDEYVLPGELLEDVLDLKRILQLPQNKGSTNHAQEAALSHLFEAIEMHFDAALELASHEKRELLLTYGEVWLGLRSKAAEALGTFGISIEHLSVDQINEFYG